MLEPSGPRPKKALADKSASYECERMLCEGSNKVCRDAAPGRHTERFRNVGLGDVGGAVYRTTQRLLLTSNLLPLWHCGSTSYLSKPTAATGRKAAQTKDILDGI